MPDPRCLSVVSRTENWLKDRLELNENGQRVSRGVAGFTHPDAELHSAALSGDNDAFGGAVGRQRRIRRRQSPVVVSQ